MSFVLTRIVEILHRTHSTGYSHFLIGTYSMTTHYLWFTNGKKRRIELKRKGTMGCPLFLFSSVIIFSISGYKEGTHERLW